MSDRINLTFFPPIFLVAYGVKRSVVGSAERHGPLVTHFAAQSPGLGKT
jgi:hypothetical protein